VQQMVASLLRLPAPIASLDASDALAVAICHATHALFPTTAFAREARRA
jgi:Holliday junction resolvasome RuvABC endonuclease subunit